MEGEERGEGVGNGSGKEGKGRRKGEDHQFLKCVDAHARDDGGTVRRA